MTKTIIGIILFLLQISLAIWFSKSIDLTITVSIAVVIFLYVIYKLLNGKYTTAKA